MIGRNPGLDTEYSPSRVRMTIRDLDGGVLIDGTMDTKVAFSTLLATIHYEEEYNRNVPEAERWGVGQ